MSSPVARAALLALALAAPAPALAHGAVEVEVERSAGGVAVRAHHHGGRPLAGATYVILSAGGRVHDAGRTDAHGWVAFVPDAPGRWTVRIVDESGHGEVAEIEVPPEAIANAPGAAGPGHAPAVAPAAATPPPEPGRQPAPPPLRATDARERAGSIYRMVGGLAVIGLVFFALFAVMIRRRGAGR